MRLAIPAVEVGVSLNRLASAKLNQERKPLALPIEFVDNALSPLSCTIRPAVLRIIPADRKKKQLFGFVMKQVMVVNESLKLPKGKLAAQVAHASVAAFIAAGKQAKQIWLENGMPKVVLKGSDEDELLRLQALAKERHISACLITDAGRTVVPAGTVTCLGLGPANENEIDALTGGLKLLR